MRYRTSQSNDRTRRKPDRHVNNSRFVNTDNPTDGQFVVLVGTINRKPLIGDKQRKAIEEALAETVYRSPGVTVDFINISQAHVQCILSLKEASMGLARMVEAFKWTSTKKLKDKGYKSRNFWQGGYYHHRLPHAEAVDAVREYLAANPTVERPRLEDVYGGNNGSQEDAE